MRRLRTAAFLLFTGIQLGAAGCGTSDGDGGSGPGPTPAIAIAISPTAVAIVQGGNGAVAATITRSGGFSGTVTIASQGAPAGVQATASGGTTTNGVTTGTVTITVGAAVAPGVYPILVRASGSGVSTVEATFTLTVTAAPAFTLALAPGTLSVAQGAAGAIQVNVTRTNLAGAIDLSATGVPAGVAVGFAPPSMTGTSATATFTAGPAATVGTHQVTIAGAAAGAAGQNAVLALTITAATPAGDFTLRVTPTGPLALPQGATGQVTVNVDRVGGLSTPVALSASSAPAGLVTTLTPPSAAGNTAQLDVMAPGGLAAGAYLLTITGSTPGVADRTTTLTVNVTPTSTGGSLVLDFSTCDPTLQPLWLAVQDGVGAAWNRILPTGHSYSFDVNQPKAGLAYVVDDGFGFKDTFVMFMSRSEMTAYAGALPCRPAGKTVSGTIVNVPGTNIGVASLGGAIAPIYWQSGTMATFEFMGVAAGSHDFLGYLGSHGSPQAGDRIVVRRDQDIAAGGSMAVLDRTGPESAEPVTALFTLNNLIAGESVRHGMGYHTTTACSPGLFYDLIPVPGSTFTGWGVPTGMQRPTDYHAVSAIGEVVGLTGESRTVRQFFRTMGPRQLALPPRLPAPAITDMSTAYKRLQFSYVAPGNYDGTASVSYDGGSRRVNVTISVLGYIGSSAITLAMPDFGAGYDPAWAPAAGATVDWTLGGSGANSLAACTEGAEIWAVTKRGRF